MIIEIKRKPLGPLEIAELINEVKHRRVVTPDDDVSGEPQEVQDAASEHWTPEVLALWAGRKVAQDSPPPTNSQIIDAEFPQSGTRRVMFEALFELTNRVIALEGGVAITRGQLKNWLENKLP